MSSNRRQGGQPQAEQSNPAQGAGRRERGQMFGDAGLHVEDDRKKGERSAPEPQHSAPTVGKTGGRGARAEKPSEGSDRKRASAPPVEVTRHSKPPAETPKACGSGKPNAAAR